jgi:hypothetical protein
VADVASTDPTLLYSPRQIYTAATLGGPLAAAWLLSRNFRLLSNYADSGRTLLVRAIVTMALIPVLLVLPKNLPPIVVPIVYSYPLFSPNLLPK